jgi:cell pole-organizing protein PopZ
MQTPAPPPVFTPEPVQYRPVPTPEPFEPQPTPTFSMPEPHPDPVPQSRPVLTVTEFVEQTISVTEEAASEPEEAASEEETQTGFWPAEPAAPAVKTNGSTPHEAHASDAPYAAASAKTLEDSVKDMLRPMLKQWLEENMTRVLTAALQDEIKKDPARFERD